jgi:hypothetical protein
MATPKSKLAIEADADAEFETCSEPENGGQTKRKRSPAPRPVPVMKVDSGVMKAAKVNEVKPNMVDNRMYAEQLQESYELDIVFETLKSKLETHPVGYSQLMEAYQNDVNLRREFATKLGRQAAQLEAMHTVMNEVNADGASASWWQCSECRR